MNTCIVKSKYIDKKYIHLKRAHVFILIIIIYIQNKYYMYFKNSINI